MYMFVVENILHNFVICIALWRKPITHPVTMEISVFLQLWYSVSQLLRQPFNGTYLANAWETHEATTACGTGCSTNKILIT